MIGVATRKGKPNHIPAISPLPFHKVKSDATWGGQSVFLRNKFIDFIGKTSTGNSQQVFALNPSASDLIPIAKFEDTIFENIEDDAFGYFYDPPKGWANTKDCGNFPCTAPSNVLLSFKGTKFTGQRP